MNFREQFITEAYNKELGALWYRIKEEKILESLKKGDELVITFDYLEGWYNYGFADSTKKGIEKEFAKLLKTDKFDNAWGYKIDGDDEEVEDEIKNIKISKCYNLDFEIT